MEVSVVAPTPRFRHRRPARRRRIPPPALVLVWALTGVWSAIVGWGVYQHISSSSPVPVPYPLQGIWVTRARGFAGTALQFTPHAIVFRSASDSVMPYPIVKIDRNLMADGLSGWYRIDYGSRVDPSRIELFYDLSTASPRMWTRSRPDVLWTPAPVPPPAARAPDPTQ